MGDAMDPSMMDPSMFPLVPPPDGIIPNFDNPASLESLGHTAMGVFIGITAAFIILRIYVKLTISKQWGWDDVTCVIAWACIVAHDIVAFTTMGRGNWLGIHSWDIRAISITKSYLQRVLTTINLYAAAAFFVKLSLFLLYLRLFNVKTKTRWAVYIGIVLCLIMYAASIIANTVLMVPGPGQPQTQESWLATTAKLGNKLNEVAVAQGAFGTASDIYLLVIPIQAVLGLQLSLQRKLGVSAIFMTGLIAIGASVGSLVIRIRLLTELDATWLSLYVYTLSAAEISAGLICSCMPICATFFHSHLRGSRLAGYFNSAFRSTRRTTPKNSAATKSSTATFGSRGKKAATPGPGDSIDRLYPQEPYTEVSRGSFEMGDLERGRGSR